MESIKSSSKQMSNPFISNNLKLNIVDIRENNKKDMKK